MWRSALVVLIAVAAAEASLQAATWISPTARSVLSRDYYLTDGGEWRPDDEFGWRPSPDFPEHDAWGFRNSAVPDTAEVVTIGDSQTYGVGVAREETWPARLEALGGPRAYNMAYGGYGPIRYWLLLEQALQLKPRTVIFAFYAGNDLYDAYYMVYKRNRFPELRSRDQELLRAIAEARQRHPIQLVVSGVEPHELSPAPTLRGFLSEHSKLYGLGRALHQMIQGYWEAAHGQGWLTIKRETVEGAPENVIIEHGPFKTILRVPYRLQALNLDDPRIAEGLRLSLTAIRLARERAKAEGAELVVLLLPTKGAVFKEVIEQSGMPVTEAYRRRSRYEAQLWRIVKAELDRQGIACVDALPTLRHCLRDGRQPYPASDDGHPNALGHEVIAQTVLAELNRRTPR